MTTSSEPAKEHRLKSQLLLSPAKAPVLRGSQATDQIQGRE